MTLNEDDQEYFKAMWHGGVDINPICHRFGISVKEMNKIAHELGLKNTLQFRWDEDNEAELARLVGIGYTFAQVAVKLGCSKETARRKNAELFPTVKNYWGQPGKLFKLKSLIESGKSASQAANELGGISRNAVIGKVHRLGLKFKKSTGPRKKLLKTTKRLPRKADIPKSNYPKIQDKTKIADCVKRSEVFQLQPGESYVSFADHKDSQCRCIKEKGSEVLGYCAEPSEEGSQYCEEHTARFKAVNPHKAGVIRGGQAA